MKPEASSGVFVKKQKKKVISTEQSDDLNLRPSEPQILNLYSFQLYFLHVPN